MEGGPLCIVVRKTVDWDSETAFRTQLRPEFAPAVRRWNETFSLPYHLFRRELARIAESNWSRVDDATRVSLDQVPSGALIVPTDDDDWFAPELARTLAAEMNGTLAGCSWRSEFLEVPISLRYRTNVIRRALFPDQGSKWICTTNNYAVRATGDFAPLVANHLAASHWFAAHPRAVTRLKCSVSAMNRSLASQTSLGWLEGRVPTRAELIRKLQRYRRLYRCPLPQRLAWCAPYVAMMGDLVDGIGVR
jgi:hypothetical protein